MENRLLEDLFRYIGQTVTIFTTSGGASGCGFTGVLICVGPTFVRLVSREGTPPTNPLAENICGDLHNTPSMQGIGPEPFMVGSVVDIPVNRIAAFVHNAISSNRLI